MIQRADEIRRNSPDHMLRARMSRLGPHQRDQTENGILKWESGGSSGEKVVGSRQTSRGRGATTAHVTEGMRGNFWRVPMMRGGEKRRGKELT